jgi:hypothetical protein
MRILLASALVLLLVLRPCSATERIFDLASLNAQMPKELGPLIIASEQGDKVIVQVPTGGGKLDQKSLLSAEATSLHLQVWLLNADGTANYQAKKPGKMSLPSLGDYSTYYAVYTFARISSQEPVALVVKFRNKLYSQLLGNPVENK